MKEPFEDYIRNNRQAFETMEENLDGLWLNISPRVEKQERRELFWKRDVWRIAAAVVVFLGIAWLAVINPVSQNKKELRDMYTFSPELAEAEGYYSSMIDMKMQEINHYRGQIDPQIFDDLKALDQAMAELEKDLQDNIDNEEVINAMIQNYRIKLEILEQIQAQFENEDNENIEL